MAALIDRVRAPYAAKLRESLAVTDTLLYRRGNFNGTFDQLIVDGLMSAKDAQIAFSPGFRWGTSLLPGTVDHRRRPDGRDRHHLSPVTVNAIHGETIKTILEDVADNLFNP
jgi:sulfur-oxidizing protein SoxB